MRIAIMGIRGVPANYGGFETFAEQLGRRLVSRGHDVTVYGRDTSVPSDIQRYFGMRIVRLPAPRAKYFETVVHTLFAAFHALTQHYDVIYVCNAANVPAVMVLRAFKRRIVLNVDGLEWKRKKWNALGRAYYRLCAWTAAQLPVHVVTDALVIQAYYRDVYHRHTDYFPYGTDLEPVPDDGLLARLGLEPGRYVLYVSRLEPENNAHVLVEGYGAVRTDLPLAIVGDAPYSDEYIASLHRRADPRVRFLGAIYGSGYKILRSHAAAYVQATEVGGTHPALVEAMGFGNTIVANEVPEHRETLADAGLYYEGAQQLAAQLQRVLDDPALARSLAARAQERARDLYGWDGITDRYEAWMESLCAPREKPRPDRQPITVSGVELSPVDFDGTVEWVVQRALSGQGGYVCTPNVDHVVRAARDPAFRRALRGADLRVPDGMWIVYGSRIAQRGRLTTVTGRLLPEAIGKALAPHGESIALFGGQPDTAGRAARKLGRRGVRVADAFGPSMGFVVGSEEDRLATERLAACGARVIFVALGAPKQELWMERHAAELPGQILIGVGAALDVLGGRVREAPSWLTTLGFEWAWRLVQEPRRLSRRYLWDDPRFLWWMIQDRRHRTGRPRDGRARR
jgi:exopolysaccharide biosynthesis WecB/TagA/CpsF family protein